MNEATNKAANIRILDYIEHDNYAIVVDKFIKMDLVYYLNTNPKFVPYNDSYQEPYPALPILANEIILPETKGMGSFQKKLLYSEVVKKQEKMSEWEHVSKQITGTIAGMLTAKAHDKIRSVFQFEWSDAIKQGNVQQVIIMIRNGLISKAAQIREFDKLKVEREIITFTRTNTETTLECNERFAEMVSRAKSMGVSKMKKKKLILLYLYANKQFFSTKNLITIESFLDSRIKIYENKVNGIKATLQEVMKALVDAEDINKQFQVKVVTFGNTHTNVPQEEVVMATERNQSDKIEKVKVAKTTGRLAGTKFNKNKKNDKRWINERNIHTMVVATKLVAEGKCQNLEEAVSKIECGICHGKYHVQADCRKNNQYPNPASSSSNKERDVMMIHQAFSTIDNYNPNGNIVCMLSDIQDTHTVTMRQLNSTRYNIDNHCNVIIYNNKDFVNNIQPVDVIVNGYGGTSKLKYTCNHNIFGPGYYDPTSPYNLLGLKPLEKMGFIEYKPKEANNEYTYLAHQTYGDIKFERTNSDFYTISHDNLVRTIQSRISKEQYRQPEDTPRMQRLDTNQQIICPVIAELQDEYTDDQYRRAEETFRLHRRLGHPSNKKLTNILNNNLIVNTILTSHDVIRMIDIFGPCETCNTVKPIKIVNQHPTFTPTDTNIGEIMHMDIVYVTKSIVFLLTVESTTNYLRAYRVIKKSDIENQISSMIAYAQLRGFTIKKIRPDSEFVLISQALRDKLATHRIDINASIPLEHEKLAESNMSRIRIKMKCIAYELKYIIPIMFLPYLFYHAIDMLNMVPNDKIKTSSPAQRYDGHKPNYITDLTISFGAACIVQNTADIDTITAKQVVAIALGRSQIHIGGIFVWIPGSTKIVVRRVLKYTKLTTSMIAAIHTLEPAGDDLVINSNKTHRVDQSNTIYEDNNHLIDNNSHIESGDDNTHDNNSHHRLNNNIMDNQQIDNNSHTTNRTRQYKRQREQDIMSNSAADKVQKITIADDNTHTMRTRSRKEIFSLLAQEYTTTQIEFKHYVDNLRTIAADYDELKQILNFGTFKFLTYLTDREQSIHNKILPAHMVRTVKYNKGKYVKHKSRLTAGGNHAEIINYTINSTSSPTVSQETLMVQLTIAVTKQYKIASVDYQAAFLNARSKAGEKHVMRINKKEALILCIIDPKLKQYLQHDGTFLVQLEKTLYGLPEAGKCWFTLLSTLLIEMGFTQCIQEPTLFKKHTDIITIHVDDLLLTYSNNLDQQIMTYFTKKNIPLKIQHLTVDNPLEHLGVVIELQLDGSLALSQIHYIETSIIDEYKPTHTYVTPAINSNHSIIEDHNQLNTTTDQPLTPMPIDKESYLKKLMRLYYVAARTRPDILTACSYASVITQPTTDDDLKLDRIIGYLLKTKHLKLHINKTDLELFAEFDAAFATHEDFKSHSGKIIFLGHIPVCFKSNKQKMNTKASAHAELNALYEGLDVLLWLRAVLTFLIPDFINDIQPLKVYQDNTSTIKIAQLGRASTKSNSRYINCRTFWIKDLIETNQINVQYLPSDQIVPDALASIRTGADFTTFRSNMQVYDLESII